jgi:hypothetical protein
VRDARADSVADDAADGRDTCQVHRRGGGAVAHVEHDCRRKPTTIRGYQALLRTCGPEFGHLLLTYITTEHIECWVWGIDYSPVTRAKLCCLSGI